MVRLWYWDRICRPRCLRFSEGLSEFNKKKAANTYCDLPRGHWRSDNWLQYMENG
jgi:hypothetical protein